MSVYAPAISFIWQAIESYGLDPRPLFEAEGIHFELPLDRGQRVAKNAVDRIRARAIEQLGVDTFGLRAAEFIHPSHFGALGYAWMASSTLRNALRRLSAFIKAFNADAEIVLEDRGTALVVTDYIYSESENYAARDDTSLAVLVQMCRFICGRRFCPDRIALRHEEPSDLGPWVEFFGCPVRFGEPENRIWINRDDADRALPGANAELAMVNEQVLAREIARLETLDFAARVRAVITSQLSTGAVSESTVAAEVKVTERTMHRRLGRQGTNFSGVLAEVRQNLAERYLRDTDLTLTEIAFMTGFAQLSSFSRAFRKWSGVPPSEFRRRARD